MNILTEEGQEFTLDIINTINEINDKMQARLKIPLNTEQVPAESVSIKLADKDRLLEYQDTYQMYSNQFIPLTVNADMLDRLMLQGKFDSHFSGGAICHINVETRTDDDEKIKQLIRTAAKMGVIYFAVNYNIQKCVNEHISVGKKDICVICNESITDNYTRVVGFIVNTKNFPKKRRELDYPERKFYKL
jgi:ribonucleoside-triphosphate reductase